MDCEPEEASMMTARWSEEDLHLIDVAGELQIAVRRADGSLRRWVSI